MGTSELDLFRSLRLELNFRRLKQAECREHPPVPTSEVLNAIAQQPCPELTWFEVSSRSEQGFLVDDHLAVKK